MSSWLALLKKEIRLGFPAFLIPVIIFSLIIGIASYIGFRTGFVWESVGGLAIFAFSGLVFYLIYYLFLSLKAEKEKLHLWLHTPMPGYSLLLAKLVSGSIYMIVTMMLTGSVLLLSSTLTRFLPDQFTFSVTINLIFLIGLHILLISLKNSIFFLFLWMTFLLFTRKIGSFLSFLLTFIIFVFIYNLYNWFSETTIYQALTKWGEFNIYGLIKDFNFIFATKGYPVSPYGDTLTLFIGIYVLEAALAFLLFYAASWILDHKVEV